jgi:hypothetical protein
MIGFQISTIIEEGKEEPSTAYKIDISDNVRDDEMQQFYMFLKHCVRHIEKITDELIENE